MSLETIGVDETRPILSHIRMGEGGEKREDVTSSNTGTRVYTRKGEGEAENLARYRATRPANAAHSCSPAQPGDYQ